QAADQMPYAPEGGDQQHAAGIGEEGEKNDQAQSGILDADLQGHRAAVALSQAAQTGHAVAQQQCQQVVADHQPEETVEPREEEIDVAAEGNRHEAEKDQQGYHPQGFLAALDQTGKAATCDHAHRHGQRQHQQHQPEHAARLQADPGEIVTGKVGEPAVQGKIEPSQDGGGPTGYRGHAHRHRQVAPGQPGHDVGKAAAGAGRDQDHAQRQFRINAQPPGDQAGGGGQQQELGNQPDHRCDRGPGDTAEVLQAQGQ